MINNKTAFESGLMLLNEMSTQEVLQVCESLVIGLHVCFDLNLIQM